MIQYRTGQLYLIRNVATTAGSYFRPIDCFPYNGHVVMYGELMSYEFRLAAGPTAVRAKPTGYGQPNLERYGPQSLAVLEMLVKRFGGSEGANLRLQVSALPPGRDPQTAAVKHAEGPEELLYGLGRIETDLLGGRSWKESWEGRTPNRDGILWAARRSLDLFDDTVRLGRVPEWFNHARQEAGHRSDERVAA